MSKLYTPTIDGPISKQMKAEQVGEYFLTTALWNSMPGLTFDSYETGVRYNGDFRLLQHDGTDWNKSHEFVKDQILKGVPYYDLRPYE